jgi:hypothetical protein
MQNSPSQILAKTKSSTLDRPIGKGKADVIKLSFLII